MKVQFVVDGKVFDKKDEALKYEADLKEKQKKEEENKAKKEAKWQEVNDAYNHFNKLYTEYINEYGKEPYFDWGKFIREFFE